MKRLTELNDVLEFLANAETYTKYKCETKNTQQVRRFVVEDAKTVFVYAPKRSRYGRRLTYTEFFEQFSILVNTVSKDMQWHKRIKKITNALEKNGLWPSLLEDYKNLYKMTLDDKEEISKLYWSRFPNKDVKVYNSEMTKWYEKYPFLAFKDEKGEYCCDNSGYVITNTFYIYEMSDAILKPMYFGSRNGVIKQQIQHAIDTKTDYSETVRTSYDVRFSYEAKTGKAWYSEEFKDCANGHYYIAISNSTALFCEND